MDPEEKLRDVGPRLRELRTGAELTLADVSARTGISTSTLSRLESGARRPTLEHLLQLAAVYERPLDDLVGPATAPDPRVRVKARKYGAMTVVPLTQRPGSLQAFKHTIPAGSTRRDPETRTHEGYEWLYVLSGRLRVVLGTNDLVLKAGEAAEFDTRVPHWFGRADDRAVEFLSIFGPQGERMHLRARPKRST